MAMTLDIPQTVSPVDALWSLFMSQTKAVKKEFTKRIKEFSAKETNAQRLREYEKTLTPSQRETAQNIANSISVALSDVRKDNSKRTPIDEFFKEINGGE